MRHTPSTPKNPAAQNLRLCCENRELPQRLKHGLADELRKLDDDTRNAEVARWISAVNTRIRESNARDRESVRARQGCRA